MVARDLEQPAQKGGGAAHLVLGIQPFEIQHGGDAVDARALPRQLQPLLAMRLGIDDQMAEMLGQGHEIAFRVDDRLLHPRGALFQQPAQQMRFAGA